MIPGWSSSRGNDLGWQIARWVRSNADALGVKYVIFDEKIWSVARTDEGWRPYEHYADCGSDTCRHLDHVHISVYGDAAGQQSADWQLPVPADTYELTSRFGECSDRWANCHTGLDFAAATGTKVRAAAAGTVIETSSGGAYGNLTKVQHDKMTSTWYAHQDETTVTEGKRVAAGEQIGTVGSTGNSTGPHLHFEVRQLGSPVAPKKWLQSHGVTP